jgi:hypothetical protein
MVFGVKKPCEKGNCMILNIGAGLEYANGTEIPNNESGVCPLECHMEYQLMD